MIGPRDHCCPIRMPGSGTSAGGVRFPSQSDQIKLIPDIYRILIIAGLCKGWKTEFFLIPANRPVGLKNTPFQVGRDTLSGVSQSLRMGCAVYQPGNSERSDGYHQGLIMQRPGFRTRPAAPLFLRQGDRRSPVHRGAPARLQPSQSRTGIP